MRIRARELEALRAANPLPEQSDEPVDDDNTDAFQLDIEDDDDDESEVQPVDDESNWETDLIDDDDLSDWDDETDWR